MNRDLSDYHSLLGVDPAAGARGIRAAFREKAKEVHPDLNPDDPRAGEKFARLRKAFSVLIALAEYRELQRKETPDPPRRELEWQMEGLENRGLDRVYRLALAPGQPLDSGRLVIPHRLDKPCPNCQGRGSLRPKGLAFLWGEEKICETCSGLGLIRRVGRTKVDLPPNPEGGFSLRLKGRGGLDPASGQRGDLILRVRNGKSSPERSGRA